MELEKHNRKNNYNLMLKITQAILIILIITIEFGKTQEQKSIHQIEWERHNNDSSTTRKSGLSTNIIPLNINLADQKELQGVVFGFLPYWVYNNPPLYFQFDLLTHIALFSFSVNANTGTISNPDNWPWTDLINAAHANGVKVVMCIVEFDNDNIHKIITNLSVKNAFFQNVRSIIETYQLDGINIDFEGLHKVDRANYINPFMADLTEYVHSNIGDDIEVSFDVPAVNWGGWNFSGLADACDYLFIMGYDFFGSWSSNAGPSAPLTGGNYNINRTLTDVNSGFGMVVNNNPEKLILGVPYYGNKWRTSNVNENAPAVQYIGSRTYASAKSELGLQQPSWSTKYNTPWYNIESSGNIYQTWFDNDSSLGLKYKLAKSKNLKGVGIWALGYDSYHPELWDLLRDEFYLSIENTSHDEFRILRNYPNPFNSSTTIEYEILADEKVVINIYNILGEKIVQLMNEFQQAGQYSILYNVDSNSKSILPSGTYFYQITTDSFSEVKKMVLLR